MSNCHHPAWLQLSGWSEATIHDEDQLHRILQGLDLPTVQRPSLVLFVGPRDKEHALRDIFPFNNFKRNARRHSGTVNIRVDTTTLRSDHPLLFSDSNPFQPSSSPRKTLHCHEVTSHLLGWKATSSDNLFDIIHARLLCLFADVVCFLCNEFWNEDSVLERLQSWAAAGTPSEAPALIRPRVIIVVKGDNASPTYNILQFEDLRFSLRQQALLKDRFSSITIVRLADERVSSISRYRRLKDFILQHVDEMRYLRQSFRCLYSASHLDGLFYAAIRHLAITKSEPFDALLASRAKSHVCVTLHDHLSTFLRLCASHRIPQVNALSVISSSILMDAYPPRMHSNISSNLLCVARADIARLRTRSTLRATVPAGLSSSS